MRTYEARIGRKSLPSSGLIIRLSRAEWVRAEAFPAHREWLRWRELHHQLGHGLSTIWLRTSCSRIGRAAGTWDRGISSQPEAKFQLSAGAARLRPYSR